MEGQQEKPKKKQEKIPEDIRNVHSGSTEEPYEKIEKLTDEVGEELLALGEGGDIGTEGSKEVLDNDGENPLSDDVGPDEEEGQSLNSWILSLLRLKTRLGEGRQKEVYRIQDPKTGKTFLVFKAKDTPDHREKTEKEAELLKKLKGNPRFLQIKESFVDKDGNVYIICDDPGTEPLQKKIEEMEKNGERMSFEDKKKLIRQLAEALSSLHELGLVHGDLFPKQIHITSERDLILGDLGDAHDPNNPNETIDHGECQSSFQLSIHEAGEKTKFDSNFLGSDNEGDKIAEMEVFARIATWILTGMELRNGIKYALDEYEEQEEEVKPELIQLMECLKKAGEVKRNKRYQSMEDLLTDLEMDPQEFVRNKGLEEDVKKEIQHFTSGDADESTVEVLMDAYKNMDEERLINIFAELQKKRKAEKEKKEEEKDYKEIEAEKDVEYFSSLRGVKHDRRTKVTTGDAQILAGLQHPSEAVRRAALKASGFCNGDGLDCPKVLSDQVNELARLILYESISTNEPKKWMDIWRSYFDQYSHLDTGDRKSELEIKLLIRRLETSESKYGEFIGERMALEENRRALTPGDIKNLSEIIQHSIQDHKRVISKSIALQVNKQMVEDEEVTKGEDESLSDVEERLAGMFEEDPELLRKTYTKYKKVLGNYVYEGFSGAAYLLECFPVLSSEDQGTYRNICFITSEVFDATLALFKTTFDSLKTLKKDDPYLNSQLYEFDAVKTVLEEGLSLTKLKGIDEVTSLFEELITLPDDARILHSFPVKEIVKLANTGGVNTELAFTLLQKLEKAGVSVEEGYQYLVSTFQPEGQSKKHPYLYCEESEEIYKGSFSSRIYRMLLINQMRAEKEKNSDGTKLNAILKKLQNEFASANEKQEDEYFFKGFTEDPDESPEREYFLMCIKEGLLEQAVEYYSAHIESLPDGMGSVLEKYLPYCLHSVMAAAEDEANENGPFFANGEKPRWKTQKWGWFNLKWFYEINRGEKIDIRGTKYDEMLSKLLCSWVYLPPSIDNINSIKKMLEILSKILRHKEKDKKGKFEEDACSILEALRNVIRSESPFAKVLEEVINRYNGLW